MFGGFVTSTRSSESFPFLPFHCQQIETADLIPKPSLNIYWGVLEGPIIRFSVVPDMWWLRRVGFEAFQPSCYAFIAQQVTAQQFRWFTKCCYHAYAIFYWKTIIFACGWFQLAQPAVGPTGQILCARSSGNTAPLPIQELPCRNETSLTEQQTVNQQICLPVSSSVTQFLISPRHFQQPFPHSCCNSYADCRSVGAGCASPRLLTYRTQIHA